MHILRYCVECTATDSPFNTKASFSKCPPCAWIYFVTRVTRHLVNSGSQFFSYKNFLPTVLTAVADAGYCFITVEVGAYGSSSDSNVFKSGHLEHYWRAINLIFQTPGFYPVMQKDYPCDLCLWVTRPNILTPSA